MKKSPRGHSNLKASSTRPWPEGEGAVEKAHIPLEGGADVTTVRELPPLALGVEEWREIGRRMCWESSALS